jgi:capsular polysaccharide biosynthesis protein
MSIKKYLFETIKYALRSYPIIRPYIKEVDRLYTMNAEELKQRNEKRFLEIFRRAYDKSPFYHKLYTEEGIRKEDITCLEDIKKLPVITKDMVKKHADEMLTVPRWQVIRANTSGTTGTPLKIYESWPSIWWTQAYTYCSRKRDGFTYGQPLVSLRGHLNRNQTSLKIHLSNTLFLSSYNINSNTVEQYYKKIVMFQPIAIEGYPSSLYSLALFLKDAELELNIPITFTSSETLLDYQRDLIEERLGTEIYDRYSMTERTIFLVESHNHAGYYEAPGFSINEYIDDGEICTSLINDAFPLIRYRSNDIMEIEEATDENPQIVVKRVNGRKEDYLHCKDGSRILRLDFIFKGVKHVKMSQLVQDKEDVLSVRVVPEKDFTDDDRNRIEQNIIARIGARNIDFRIELITENEIQLTPRGKYKFIINLMNVNRGGVIKRILGRKDDYVICKDGSLVTRIDFIESGQHIKACQWVQEEKGKVIVYIVPDENFTEADARFVKNETLKRVGFDNMEVSTKIVAIEDLIYTQRGKFKLIVRKTNETV